MGVLSACNLLAQQSEPGPNDDAGDDTSVTDTSADVPEDVIADTDASEPDTDRPDSTDVNPSDADAAVDTDSDLGDTQSDPSDTDPMDSGNDTNDVSEDATDVANDTGDVDEDTDAPDTDTGSGCDFNGFESVNEQIQRQEGGGSSSAIYLSTDAELNQLSIEIYEDFGGLGVAGEYEITDQNYADCGNCVLIRVCNNETCSNPSQIFLARSGTLELLAPAELFGELDANFEGTLRAVTFTEVTINADTFTSTPVPNGETWCVDLFEFNSPISTP